MCVTIPYRTAKYLNLPILLLWQFRAQPPNLITADISTYTVYSHLVILPGLYLQVYAYILAYLL